MWLVLLVWVGFCKAFQLVDLDNVSVRIEGPKCDPDIPDDLVLIVHSAPQNSGLRQAIRQSWGSDLSRIFIVASNPDFNNQISQESDQFGDIFQPDFQDAYRNLTYKHLAGYWWVSQYCSSAKYVLKTDDDQFVDVNHLRHFLRHYISLVNRPYFLCYLIEGEAPKRDKSNKWFVSPQEYSQAEYPDYCSGWAYVTSISTISSILEKSRSESYFWIDDLHVTGTLASKLEGIKYYNWRQNFLSEHAQYKEAFLKGKMLHPEVMVASDLEPQEIVHVAEKFAKCNQMRCYDQIYNSEENKALMRPAISESRRSRTEL